MIGTPNISNMSDNKDLTYIYDYLIKISRELNDMLYHLDSDNIRQILTDRVEVRSEDGTTEIKGNMIRQTDNYQTRLLLGYDINTGKFRFAVYDADGNLAIYMDDNGDAVFTGNVTGSTITGSEINGGTINGAEINGGTITVDTDIHVGKYMYMKPFDFESGIRWKESPVEMYMDPGTETIHFYAPGGVWVNGVEVGIEE